MSERKVCGRPIKDRGPCPYPRMPGKQRCGWHWLPGQPADIQAAYANGRRARVAEDARRARVPSSEWPEGERWCAGCQTFVPLFYCTGSRCKACASAAAHAARVEKVYGISAEEYDALFELQGGVCYVCQRRSKAKRLAVDHDHGTGAVRGLLCPDNERGCNHAVLGSLTNAEGGPLEAARRLVEYLEDPPYARLRRERGLPEVAPPPGPSEDQKQAYRERARRSYWVPPDPFPPPPY